MKKYVNKNGDIIKIIKFKSKMSKREIEDEFDCKIESYYDNGFLFHTAYANNDDCGFESASGWNLKELLDDIEENLYEGYKEFS